MYVREDRIVNWEGKGVGGRGDAQSRTPFSIAVQYPNWLGQQSRWGPHETVRPRQAAKRKSPFPRVAHASNKETKGVTD